ncbi:MAG: hypothetical protein QXM27_01515 [Candidatus Pacearchaeota archaeon]
MRETIEKNLFISIDNIEEKELKRLLYRILECLIKCQTSIEEIKEANRIDDIAIKKIDEKFLILKKRFDEINYALPKSEEKKIEKVKKEKEIVIKKEKKKKEKIEKVKISKKISLMKELEEIRKKLRSLE